MFVDFNILNQLGSPSINSNTFANRPAAGQTGRLFVSTDTFEIYRDNGTTWDLIGGPGSSTITGTGTATQVAYFTSSQAIGSSANLFWDNTSGFLGVATATPSARIEAVKTDGVGIYANYTTNAGSGSSTTALWAKNVTNGGGFSAVIEETTPNTTAGQYPLLIKHSLSSGTAGVGMGTGIHWQLPDDAGTFKTTQLTIETTDAAAATYKTRYRFNVLNNGSSLPVAYINSTGLGIFTATPGAALDIHSTGTIAQFNTTSATGNTYIAFQRTGTGVWRMGDNYSAGNNFFELHNTALATDALQVAAATNKTSWQATQTYTTGLARGNYFDYNLSVSAGGSFSSPNSITALGASLDLTLAGNATIPSGARSGLDAYNSIAFTGAGTLTHGQGTQIRAYSNLTAGWAFNGSATGTVTHLAGLRALFPDNTGSAINVTNNYALLLNDQTPNTGTVTYTNRWGVYQEGASDLNYMAANLLLGSTTNSGEKLQVTGTAKVSSTLTAQILAVNTDGQTVTISSNYDLTTDGKNIFIGGGGNSVTIDDDVINGSYHTAVGVEALFSNTYGTSNTAIGYRSLYTNNTGSNNTAIGNSSQYYSVGTDNTSVGSASLLANTTGFSNTAIGSQSQQYNTEGIFNNSFGYYSLNSNTLGNNNTAIGSYSVEYNSTGSDNIGIGYQAGKYFGTTSALTTCNSSVFIGNTTKASANNNTNEIVIGHTAVGNGSNSVTLGNSSITKTILRGNVLIGTTTSTFAAERLQVSGDINTFNSVGGGVFTYAANKQANLYAGGIGLYMNDYTFSGSDYHQVEFLSSTLGDQVIFKATVKDDGTRTLIYLGDYIGVGNGTVMYIDDFNSSVNFNSGVGKYQFGSVPQFANNAAAIAAGYPAGYIYRLTGTGDLKIVI